MNRNKRHTIRHAGRWRPRLERLDHRLALSLGGGPLPLAALAIPTVSSFTAGAEPLGPNLSVVSTDPLPGATLTQSPTSFTVTFDRPLDINYLLTEDILVQREDGGTWSPAYDMLSIPTEDLDATGTQLILTPTGPLAPGHYRLVLPTGSSLTGLDGSTIADPGYDQVLADFTLAQPGVTLADATPVAGVVPGPASVTGQLDLATDPGAVALYRVDLPAGHHWRLGAEVSTPSGSTLLSTLALFDTQGHLIATVSHGRPGAPTDTYMFAGLEAGTYYLGVSARGNIPGQPGGYDPVTGARGLGGIAGSGGPFRLDVVADPADTPARLLGFQLNYADPLSPSPTGMTLSFSSALNLDALRGDVASGLQLIGPDGHSVGMTTVGYQANGGQYYFIFDQPLAAGNYSLRVAPQGGVTDLAGLTPIAQGEKPGQLAHFHVNARPNRAHDSGDLGAFYPDMNLGVNHQDTIDPGTAVTYRFVSLAKGLYQFSVVASEPGARVELRLLGPDGLVRYGDATHSQPAIFLRTGVYYVQLVNMGTAPIHVSWWGYQNTPWDSLLDNGIGQESALNLRLVNPAATPADPTPDATGQGPGWASSPAGPTSSPGGAPVVPVSTSRDLNPAAGAPVSAPGQAGLVLTLGDTPVGRPAGNPSAGSPLGIGPGAGSLVTASLAAPVPQAIGVGESLLAGRRFDPQTLPDPTNPSVPGTDATAGQDTAGTSDMPTDGAMVAASYVAPSPPDDLVLAAADWVARFGRGALGLLSSPTPGESGDDPTTGPADAASVAAGESVGELEGAGRVEHAQFDAPVILGVASVVAMRYHEPMVRWLRRAHPSFPSRRGPAGGGRYRGPHRRT